MARYDALFAAIEADPSPIVEMAIERLTAIQGAPVRETARDVRFRRNASLWIDRRTGHWRDWTADVGGGSWRLATDLAGLSAREIADLYGIDAGRRLTRREQCELEAAAEQRQRALADAERRRRRAKHQDAARLLETATPCCPGDPASLYLQGRGLHRLSDLWFHPCPMIRTINDRDRRLAPSLLYEVTDGAGHLCAVHAVQLDVVRNKRLPGRKAKLSIGSLMEGFVRFGPRSPVVCLGEGAETVASVHEVVPRWRCLASCSGIRLVDADPDLAAAREILLLAERGVEDKVREQGEAAVARWPTASIYLVHVPPQAPGDKADMNDVLRRSADLVRHALSVNQLECVHAGG